MHCPQGDFFALPPCFLLLKVDNVYICEFIKLFCIIAMVSSKFALINGIQFCVEFAMHTFPFKYITGHLLNSLEEGKELLLTKGVEMKGKVMRTTPLLTGKEGRNEMGTKDQGTIEDP
jgi:hypothetical protein